MLLWATLFDSFPVFPVPQKLQSKWNSTLTYRRKENKSKKEDNDFAMKSLAVSRSSQFLNLQTEPLHRDSIRLSQGCKPPCC